MRIVVFSLWLALQPVVAVAHAPTVGGPAWCSLCLPMTPVAQSLADSAAFGNINDLACRSGPPVAPVGIFDRLIQHLAMARPLHPTAIPPSN